MMDGGGDREREDVNMNTQLYSDLMTTDKILGSSGDADQGADPKGISTTPRERPSSMTGAGLQPVEIGASIHVPKAGSMDNPVNNPPISSNPQCTNTPSLPATAEASPSEAPPVPVVAYKPQSDLQDNLVHYSKTPIQESVVRQISPRSANRSQSDDVTQPQVTPQPRTPTPHQNQGSQATFRIPNRSQMSTGLLSRDRSAKARSPWSTPGECEEPFLSCPGSERKRFRPMVSSLTQPYSDNLTVERADVQQHNLMPSYEEPLPHDICQDNPAHDRRQLYQEVPSSPVTGVPSSRLPAPGVSTCDYEPLSSQVQLSQDDEAPYEGAVSPTATSPGEGSPLSNRERSQQVNLLGLEAYCTPRTGTNSSQEYTPGSFSSQRTLVNEDSEYITTPNTTPNCRQLITPLESHVYMATRPSKDMSEPPYPATTTNVGALNPSTIPDSPSRTLQPSQPRHHPYREGLATNCCVDTTELSSQIGVAESEFRSTTSPPGPITPDLVSPLPKPTALGSSDTTREAGNIGNCQGIAQSPSAARFRFHRTPSTSPGDGSLGSNTPSAASPRNTTTMVNVSEQSDVQSVNTPGLSNVFKTPATVMRKQSASRQLPTPDSTPRVQGPSTNTLNSRGTSPDSPPQTKQIQGILKSRPGATVSGNGSVSRYFGGTNETSQRVSSWNSLPTNRTSSIPSSTNRAVTGMRRITNPVHNASPKTTSQTVASSQPPDAGSRSRVESSDEMTSSDVVDTRPGRVQLGSDGEPAEVILSLMWAAQRLAVAIYDPDTMEISMMPDTHESEDFQLLKNVIHQIEPAVVILSAKQDERVLAALHAALGEEVTTTSERLHMLPSIYFGIDHSKRRILLLDLPVIPKDLNESERTVFLSSLLPLENLNMVRAVGGLLKYLDRHRVGVELESSEVQVPVLNINIFRLDDMVMIDENTYSALQIFSREDHPSVYKTGMTYASKEGFSLFGIMNRCRSQMGKRQLRYWFLRPTTNLEVLRERQQAISFFLNPRHLEINSLLLDSLRHIKNLNKILLQMKQSQASIADWQSLNKTVYNAIYIGDVCRANKGEIPIFTKIADAFTDDLHRIANLINRIVDFEESQIQKSFVVKPGVDPELDRQKRIYHGLPDFMTRIAHEELQRLADEDITSCNVIYLPQLGYMLALPLEDVKDRDKNNIPNLQFMFISNEMAHFKTQSTQDLDLLLGDTQCDIRDRETSIMHQLQEMILEHSSVLLTLVQLTAELDCLLSLACCAREGNYVCPELNTSRLIEINGGRHPLQELCCTPFMPNGVQSGSPHSQVKVLTGPNASGKSVYIKQVGLLVYLAQIGSFIPAESASIGVVDAIYSRIHTKDSVSDGFSTFMIDLNQVSGALQHATNRSLVLLDEFGKGTQTDDGLALLCACLKYWLAKGKNCPHVYATTHFHSLITRGLLPPSSHVSYQTMDVLQDEAELVFLYHLIDGSTDMSYACHIATMAGLPAEIVKRGEQVTDLLRRHQPIRSNESISKRRNVPAAPTSEIRTKHLKQGFTSDSDLYQKGKRLEWSNTVTNLI